MGPTRVTVQASLPPDIYTMSNFYTIPQMPVKKKSTRSIQRATRYGSSNPSRGLGRATTPPAHQMDRRGIYFWRID